MRVRQAGARNPGKVHAAFAKFEQATHAGVHLEKINNVRDTRLRSIRIDQSWRGVVLAPESGGSYTLFKVLPHDDAYDWACRRRVSINRTTSSLSATPTSASTTTASHSSRSGSTSQAGQSV